mmetsp:Transcript_41232/g.117640  ORF Transcript_41232/g.117640 Transcript_41232/m.117640 type:complete len:324 (-) Transcript_41232:1928-2899(-)
MTVRHLIGDVLVETEHEQNWPAGKCKVEHAGKPFRICYIAREADLERPYDVAPGQCYVLIQVVAQVSGHAPVGAAAVAQQQRHEEPELRDGDVASHDRLRSLLAPDAYAQVRALNHRHVIGAVADGQRDARAVLILHQLHELPLLLRGQATADAGAALCGELEEEQALGLAADGTLHETPINDQATRGGARQIVPCRLQERQCVLLAGAVDQVGQPHLRSKEPARAHYLHCGLGLVPGQDPEADARCLDGLDGLGDTPLEPVLHGRYPRQPERLFHLRGDGHNQLFAAHGLSLLRRPEPLVPVLVKRAVHDPRGYRQRAEPLV